MAQIKAEVRKIEQKRLQTLKLTSRVMGHDLPAEGALHVLVERNIIAGDARPTFVSCRISLYRGATGHIAAFANMSMNSPLGGLLCGHR